MNGPVYLMADAFQLRRFHYALNNAVEYANVNERISEDF